MQTEINLIQSFVNSLIEKGWNATVATTTLKIEGLEIRAEYTQIYPKFISYGGDEIKPERDYIYIYHPIDFSNPDFYLEKIARIPSLKEHRTASLFTHLEKLKDLAAEMKLPADFINPLTVMAEQLRTNILEHKKD